MGSRASSLTVILEWIDWMSLPSETRPIASMLADGWTQKEIAMRLGRSEDQVAGLVEKLRVAMVEQALAKADALSVEVRALLEERRR